MRQRQLITCQSGRREVCAFILLASIELESRNGYMSQEAARTGCLRVLVCINPITQSSTRKWPAGRVTTLLLCAVKDA